MDKMKQNKRQLFENPTRDLFDLFAYISRSLPDSSIYIDEDSNYLLKTHSLQVKYSIHHQFEKGKKEFLEIKKNWQDCRCIEKITIQDEYLDLREWLVEEVLEYLSLINDNTKDSIEQIKRIQSINGLPAYKDSFALDLAGIFFELSKSKFEYYTDNISRGLQTFALLFMSAYVDWRAHSGKSFLNRTFTEMLSDKEISHELDVFLGKRTADKKRRKYLKLGKMNITKSFEFTQEDKSGFSAWRDCKVEIVSLCKYYSGLGITKEPNEDE